MRLRNVFRWLMITLFVGCTNTGKQQNKLTFTFQHVRTETSKDSNSTTYLLILSGNLLKYKHQREGSLHSQQETTSSKVTLQEVDEIINYMQINQLLQNRMVKNHLPGVPGIVHQVKLKVTYQNETYTLTCVQGNKLGERSKNTAQLYKQLLNFESFLGRKLKNKD